MEKLIFTNSRGEEIEFFSAPYRLKSIEGIGDVKADIQSEKSPFQDGDTFIDAIFEPRFVEIEFNIIGNNYEDVSSRRSYLARVTNPKLGLGILRYESDDLVRVIEAVAESVPIFGSGRENRTDGRQVTQLSFKCPNPYWKTEGIEAAPTFEPLFQFPFEGEFEMGISRDERSIINNGDSEIPFEVEFYGPATNPTITNLTTGEFIKVNQTLLEGEYMRINTADNRKSVVFINSLGVERNVFNWIDLDSTFFKLILGENVLSYSADSDIQGSVVNFYYQQQYNTV